jgi:hypothetical protein
MEGNKVCSVRDLQTGGVLWATRDGDYWQVARRARQRLGRRVGWWQQSGVRSRRW